MIRPSASTVGLLHRCSNVTSRTSCRPKPVVGGLLPLSLPLLPPQPRAAVTPPLASRRHLQSQMFWLPPVVFVGLLGSLWVWKCAMMVVFQNKIIYMPGLPPNARRERIEDYSRYCGGVQWEERRLRAADGTDLALCVAEVEADGGKPAAARVSSHALPTRPPVAASLRSLSAAGDYIKDPKDMTSPVYIIYFQGNASSLPPRLQDLSWVLKDLQKRPSRAKYTMVCLSYRGYWTSRGRPSEKGINIDAQAALEYVTRLHAEAYGENAPDPVLIFWGQSIGSGVATNLAAWVHFPSAVGLDALILETVFTSVRAMLLAVYPPKWVPYRYLWPFLRNHLDSLANLDKIAARKKRDGDESGPRITIVEAGRDELVPAEHGAQLLQRGLELGLSMEKKTVPSAFHSDVMIRGEGRKAVADAIEKAVVSSKSRARALDTKQS